jgi:hypothetical protein
MQNLLIVIASNRAQPNDGLLKSLVGFASRGTAIIHHTGTTDVALARNISLTLVYSVLQQKKHDIVLMLDDDMIFTDTNVIAVIRGAFESNRPTSACYVTAEGLLAARWKNSMWFTGLGFLAIPSAKVLALGDASQKFVCPISGVAKGMDIIQFTESRIVETDNAREWQGEDYVLCERLGGVNLIPISVGHLKQKVLQPSAEHLKSFLEEQEQA